MIHRDRHRMIHRVLAATLLLWGWPASGQGSPSGRWTVQTAAFQDYRQASSQIAQLVDLGFDAYGEFVMREGRQFTRVRIGCFTDRAAAEAVALELKGNVTAEAAAQPLSERVSYKACVEWDPGFLKPQEWRTLRQGEDIVFRVELGGQVGYLQHDGSGWEFGRTLPPQRAAAPAGAPRFREVRIGGLTLVQARLEGGGTINACPGELLWQRGLTAVVERSDSVIACVVDEPPPGAAP